MYAHRIVIKWECSWLYFWEQLKFIFSTKTFPVDANSIRFIRIRPVSPFWRREYQWGKKEKRKRKKKDLMLARRIELWDWAPRKAPILRAPYTIKRWNQFFLHWLYFTRASHIVERQRLFYIIIDWSIFWTLCDTGQSYRLPQQKFFLVFNKESKQISRRSFKQKKKHQ